MPHFGGETNPTPRINRNTIFPKVMDMKELK